jgi:hypothetical protein
MQPATDEMRLYRLQQRANAGANWFYWVAALSLVNSISNYAGSTWGFIAGLGITQALDALVGQAGGAKLAALGADLLVALVFVAAGWWAHRLKAAFLLGMALYTIDALIFLLIEDWVSLAFHGFVLWSMFSGLQAFKTLRRERQQQILASLSGEIIARSHGSEQPSLADLTRG